LIGAAFVVSEARAQAPVPQPQPGTGSAIEPVEPAEPQSVTTVAPPPSTDVPAPAAPPPQPVVVHQGMRGSDAGMLIGSGALFGAGIVLFFASQSDYGDADAAVSFDDHERIAARADRLRIASIVSAGAGIALGVIALYRIKVTKEGTDLAVAPKRGGAALVLETSW
jgi:hypothetical protein